MKKTRMMMFSLVLFGLLLVAVPAKAASIREGSQHRCYGKHCFSVILFSQSASRDGLR